MQAPTTDLVRALREAPELRSTEDESLGYLSGHVITWGDWYEVNSAYEGRFMERMMSGSTTKTITENRAAIKILFDHGKGPSGNMVLGPLDVLEEDAQGLRYGLPLFDTSYNRDLLPGLKAGVYGASHRFRAIKDGWVDKPERSAYNPNGLPERTVLEIGIAELGPVTFPASPTATAGVRCASLTDEWRSHYAVTDLATPIPEPATGQATEPDSTPRPTDRERRMRALELRGLHEPDRTGRQAHRAS